MNVLIQLTEDQKTLLVSLPYRAGYYISQSDTTGGTDADMQEMRTLDNIIHGFAHEVFGSETVQHIMVETLARKADWTVWGAELDEKKLLEDCRRAMDILGGYIDDKDCKAYAARLMEIAEAVALAFAEQEVEPESLPEKIKSYAETALGKVKAQQSNKEIRSLKQFRNISKDERKALMGLAEALGAAYS